MVYTTIFKRCEDERVNNKVRALVELRYEQSQRRLLSWVVIDCNNIMTYDIELIEYPVGFLTVCCSNTRVDNIIMIL